MSNPACGCEPDWSESDSTGAMWATVDSRKCRDTILIKALKDIELMTLFPASFNPQSIFDIAHKALNSEWEIPK